MAEDLKLLIDVDGNADKMIVELSELREKVKNLKKEQKELDTTTQEGAVAYEKLAIDIKKAQGAIRTKTALVTKSKQANDQERDSLDQLKLNLSIATAAYDKLGVADRKAAEGKALKKYIAETKDELKLAKFELNDYRLNVGNYTDAINQSNVSGVLQVEVTEKIRKGMGELRAELKELQNVPLSILPPEQAEAVLRSIADVKTEISDLNKEIASRDTDNTFSLITDSANVAVASVTILTNSLSSLGVESPALDKVRKSTMQLIATMQALDVISTYIRKNRAVQLAQNLKIVASNISETLAKKALNIELTKQNLAENASIATKAKLIVSTKLITAAQWLWNKAVMANPVVALATAVIALGVGIASLVGWYNKESEASKNARIAEEKYQKTKEQTARNISKINNEEDLAIENQRLRYRELLNDLKSGDAEKAEIAKKELERENKIREIQKKASEEREKEQIAELKALEEKIIVQRKDAERIGIYSKKHHEEMAILKDLIHERDNLTISIEKEGIARQNLLLDQIENEYAYKKELEDSAKDAKKASQDRLNAAISSYEKEVDANKELRKSLLRSEADFQNKDLSTRQEYARKLNEIDIQAQKDKLENLRKYNKITESEYIRSLQVIDAGQKEFHNGQIAELNKFYEDQRKEILSFVEKTADEEVEAVTEKYQKALDKIGSMEAPTPFEGESDDSFEDRLLEYQNFLLRKSELAVRFERQEAAEIKAIREQEQRATEQLIQAELDSAYSERFAKATFSEEQRLKLVESKLKEEITKRKESGLKTTEQEQALKATLLNLEKIEADKALLLAGNNAGERYRIKKQFLEKEKQAYEEGSIEQLQIEQDIADAEKELWNERIQAFEAWSSQIMGLFSAVTDLFSANIDKRVAKFKKGQEDERKSLDENLKKGLISQEKYDERVQELDNELEAERERLELKQAKRQKALNIASATMDTAAGVVKAVKASPETFGLPFSAFVAATGAAQIAAIAAQPITVAARGGLIEGNTHAKGGEWINAEDGEVIINRKSSVIFGPLLSEINELGGGVPFRTPGSDGGFMLRNLVGSQQITADDFADALQELKLSVAVEDIRREDRIYGDVESRGEVFSL